MDKNNQMITIFTDGACSGNPGPGGWAALIASEGKPTQEIGGSEAHTTNNRMEMRAAIEGLQKVSPSAKVRIVTDSQYLVRGITEWIRGWKRRDWMTLEGAPVENRELWEELDRLAGNRVTWEHVRGHAGHPENERANTIAQAYAAGRKPAPVRQTPTTGTRPAGASYLSLVDGTLARHHTWDECKERVHGVSGAKFKKCATFADEQATVATWGLDPSALEKLQ